MAEIEDMLPGSSPQPYPTPPSVLELTVDRPYYHNGDLKANVSWIIPEEGTYLHTCRAVVFVARQQCMVTGI